MVSGITEPWNISRSYKANGRDDLDITPERKREIDEILKETHKKYINQQDDGI